MTDPHLIHTAEKSKRRRFIPMVILLILLVIAIATATVLYIKYEQLKDNPAGDTAAQASKVEAEVGKLINLPTGETPTLATVQDPAKLKSQPFFANAQKGDQLLIYTNAKQAIIYRPSSNKIINVGPIAISSSATSDGASTSP